MAYTLSTMLTEVYARGFSYLNDGAGGVTRATRWINDAMHDIDDIDKWQYREATATGTAPLTISDLGDIDTVVDTTGTVLLDQMDRRELLDRYGSLTTTGTPSYWYLTGGNAVNLYPANTSVSLSIDYWKVSPDLVSVSDTPLMPDRFRPAIVELACAKAYRDSDNPAMAAVCQQEADRIVSQMRENFVQQASPHVVVYGYSQDW